MKSLYDLYLRDGSGPPWTGAASFAGGFYAFLSFVGVSGGVNIRRWVSGGRSSLSCSSEMGIKRVRPDSLSQRSALPMCLGGAVLSVPSNDLSVVHFVFL